METTQKSELRILSGVFILCLLSRLVFKFISGYDNYELFGDALRYDMLSNRILSGDYNLDMVAFITAPLYPWTMAILKFICPSSWPFLLSSMQLILISLSAAYIYRISYLLFGIKKAAIISALVYIFYPLGMWYNFTFTQESFFQAFFIFFAFYFYRCLMEYSLKDVLLSALFLSLCFLTKYHIVLLLPFIFLILLWYLDLKKALIIPFIVIFSALPQAILNYSIHGDFSITGFAAGSMLLAGHSDETYPCLTNEIYQYPEIIEFGCNLDIVFHAPYEDKNHGFINRGSPSERNRKRITAACDWIRTHPGKFMTLKYNGLKRLFIPGLDNRIYGGVEWWISFLYGLIFYIPAALASFIFILNKERHIHLVLASFMTIAIIFLVFYPQNRFRLIGFEALLIVYAGYIYNLLLNRLFNR